MSMNELNTTARDLMSVRAMIEELQAEAEALTDKLKAALEFPAILRTHIFVNTRSRKDSGASM